VVLAELLECESVCEEAGWSKHGHWGVLEVLVCLFSWWLRVEYCIDVGWCMFDQAIDPLIRSMGGLISLSG